MKLADKASITIPLPGIKPKTWGGRHHAGDTSEERSFLHTRGRHRGSSHWTSHLLLTWAAQKAPGDPIGHHSPGGRTNSHKPSSTGATGPALQRRKPRLNCRAMGISAGSRAVKGHAGTYGLTPARWVSGGELLTLGPAPLGCQRLTSHWGVHTPASTHKMPAAPTAHSPVMIQHFQALPSVLRETKSSTALECSTDLHQLKAVCLPRHSGG